MTNKGEFLIQVLTTRVVQKYAADNKISIEEALRLFLSTKTYSVLVNQDSGMYLESFNYLYDILIAELSGKEWIEYE